MISNVNNFINAELEEKTKSHPCYSGGCQSARIHLPIAPACNISCNYCNRKFDCVNESRPGVTSDVLNPHEALERYIKVKNKLSNLKVVGIAGPGDALANFENTKKTLELIREVDPDVTFCLSTNGLLLPYYASDLVKLGVTHITVTINAIDPKIGAKIYSEVNIFGIRHAGEKAAEILLKNQLAGIKMLVALGIVVKVNVVMIKGINDEKIEEVIKTVKKLGVFISNIMPLIPASGSVFEDMPLTSNKELNDIRKSCEVHLKQMYHCKQCRADAIGTLDEDCSQDFREIPSHSKKENLLENTDFSYTFAVSTRSGKVIDEHFGHAKEYRIYKYEKGGVEFVDTRAVEKFCNGPSECDEDERLDSIIKTIEDCDVILTMRIGHSPQKILEGKGKLVVQVYGNIEDEIKKVSQLLIGSFLKV
ncbi:MAG TPA: nitrogenase cofactor biosynthesis protein NifB [Pseudobacteroides sp.]|uniref:nitrogenase cofactor biosynthesis protein NifB n=1 Tax=Pseudobacteroides sp. TaxID=1968840 RepID=UPI002F94A266